MLIIFLRNLLNIKSFFNIIVKDLLVLKKILIIFFSFLIENFILIFFIKYDKSLFIIQLTVSLVILKSLNKKYII